MAGSFSAFDEAAMRRALELARRGLETTHPNPRVGCVIARGERIVGEGWHERAGEAHAEVVALRAAGSAARGATAYVTLEPCCHHGRTPPCTDALIAARVSRVVYAAGDPNPRVNGGGAAALRAAGIVVEGGLLADEAEELNRGFFTRMRRGRPWVTLKLAMSLDGRTALANGESRWITGPAAREDVHRWRARSSAVVTGVGTVLADDPRLDVRLPGENRRQPLRVVLDSRLRTPPEARLFEAPGEVLILTCANDAARAEALGARGASIEFLPEENGRVALDQALDRLGELEINEVLVEAGPTLAGEFLRRDLADELLVYVAPVLLGVEARPLADLPQPASLAQARRFSLCETRTVGTDVCMRLRRAASAAGEADSAAAPGN